MGYLRVRDFNKQQKWDGDSNAISDATGQGNYQPRLHIEAEKKVDPLRKTAGNTR